MRKPCPCHAAKADPRNAIVTKDRRAAEDQKAKRAELVERMRERLTGKPSTG